MSRLWRRGASIRLLLLVWLFAPLGSIAQAETIAPAGTPGCGGFTFPYTLTGADNTARVAELRQAIECANANATDDEISLDGHTLIFADAPYANDGNNALPPVSSNITLRNGAIERDPSASAFRLIRIETGGIVTLRNLQLRHGSSAEGGAILTDGNLTLRDSVLEHNTASSHGGGVRARGMVTVVMTRFSYNHAPNGAALSFSSNGMIVNTRFDHNGNAGTDSVMWSEGYSAMLGILFHHNQLTAPGSSLMVFAPAASVTEMRHATLADNTVQGLLLRMENASSAQVRNSILWNNQAASLGVITPVYSILPGVPPVSGNLDQDPQFIAPGIYRLAAGSPAIDAGENANSFFDMFDVDNDGITMEALPDLDLNPRPIDDPTAPDTGVLSGPPFDLAIVDMGAYERQTDACYDYAFPYTLSGSNNTARVAELRQAIECANANATDDVIDLAGQTLIFSDADVNSPDNTLPEITSTITLQNGTLQRDTSAPSFRLLAITYGAHLFVDSVNFRNGLTADGGAIYNVGELDVVNAGFFDNGHITQTSNGGAVFSRGDTLRIIDSHFQNNAAQTGGALYVDSPAFFLRGSHLENNHATQGGALYGLSGLHRLLNTQFVANTAAEGGALFLEGLTIRSSGLRFVGNSATAQGGAMALRNMLGDLILGNSLFVGNQAPQGVVLHADEAVYFGNVTISGHASAGDLFVMTSAGQSVQVSNSILWGNGSTPTGAATISHSVVEGGFLGGTNILNMDPLFTDAANNDFRLMPHSPAIDAGNNADVRFDTWMDIDEDGDFSEELDDLGGNPRRYDDTGVTDTGLGTAPIVDMGAFERQTNSPPIVLPSLSINDVSANEGHSGTTNFTFTVFLSQPANAGGVSFDIATANGTASAPGDYISQSLTGQTIAAGSSTYTFTVQVNGDSQMEGNETFFVNVTNVTGATVADGQGLGTIVNDDAAGITVTPVSGLITTEGMGPTGTHGVDQFSVVLTSQPTAEVTIALSSSDTTEGTVSPTSLSFTPANWHLPQNVDVLSVDDAIVDGDIAYTIITAPAVSADANYNGLNPADVSVTNIDNDTAGITVTPTSGLTTTEAGGTATFTVVLTSQPTADVSIGLSSSNTAEGTVAPATLTFTQANWNTAQTVTVTGVDDAIVDGDIAYTIITAPAVSADANYNGVNPADVSVTNIDDDAAGISVNPTSGLTTTEAGGTATFTVVLTSQPTADVSIGLSSSDTAEGTVAPATLTFTQANWSTAQTVTVTGVDDAIVDGDIAYTIITAPAVSADANYNGVNPADVSVTNIDDDAAGMVVIAPPAGLITTEHGGTDSFTLVLASQPTADVTIPLSSSNPAEGTVAPASLTFTPANWNVPQTVVVTGVGDGVVDGDVAYAIHIGPTISADPAYSGMNHPDVAATNLNVDLPAAAAPIMVPASGTVALWAMAILMWIGSAVTLRRR